MSNTIGYQRFKHYLNILQPILAEADNSKTPAVFLYEKGIRTQFFMLEALSRVYENLHNKKTFGKLKDRFKLVEDLLGAVDYYDAFVKQFAKDKKIPATIKKYLVAQRDYKLALLEQTLRTDGWIGDDNHRIRKINAKLEEADWLPEKDDCKQIRKLYKKTIVSIKADIDSNEIDFNNVEEDVHELRRELRWLSIYPQCFGGLFQLDKTAEPDEILEKYQTPEIVNSAFNKMPPADGLSETILLDAANFYALSWMIAELGTLKDNGLKIEVLKEAILATGEQSETEAEIKAFELSGEGQLSIADILVLAKKISDRYFAEGSVESLVISS